MEIKDNYKKKLKSLEKVVLSYKKYLRKNQNKLAKLAHELGNVYFNEESRIHQAFQNQKIETHFNFNGRLDKQSLRTNESLHSHYKNWSLSDNLESFRRIMDEYEQFNPSLSIEIRTMFFEKDIINQQPNIDKLFHNEENKIEWKKLGISELVSSCEQDPKIQGYESLIKKYGIPIFKFWPFYRLSTVENRVICNLPLISEEGISISLEIIKSLNYTIADKLELKELRKIEKKYSFDLLPY